MFESCLRNLKEDVFFLTHPLFILLILEGGAAEELT